MRVLLAIDGSPCSDAATQLVASLRWPEGTVVRVLAVAEPAGIGLATASPYPMNDPAGVDLSEALLVSLADAVRTLDGPGRLVESRLVEGRAATVIVKEAEALHADLVVVGSRGLGRIGSMVLGSVSAEVVDHAPCAVLVARAASVNRVLLAVDGSPTSWRAVEHVAGLGYLGDTPFEVLAVEPRLPMPLPVIPGGISDATLAGDAVVFESSRAGSEQVAARVTHRLRNDGIDAQWSVSVGDPAHEIVTAVETLACDLVAVGSRGQTGFTRLLVGSVAHTVLMHAKASVLVVREPIRQGARDPLPTVEAPTPIAVG